MEKIRERLRVDWPGVFLVYCANGLDGISINVGHGSRSAPLPHLLINSLGLPFPLPVSLSREYQTSAIRHRLSVSHQATPDKWRVTRLMKVQLCYLWMRIQGYHQPHVRSQGTVNAETPEAVLTVYLVCGVYVCMIMSLPRSMMVSALTRLRGKDNIRDTSPASADQKRSGARWKGARL